jgi:hypothetical protein
MNFQPHEYDHEGEVRQPRLTDQDGGEAFVIAGEWPEAAEPAEGSLDDPPSGPQHETAGFCSF